MPSGEGEVGACVCEGIRPKREGEDTTTYYNARRAECNRIAEVGGAHHRA